MTKEQTINKQILDMFNDSTYQGLKAYYEKTTVFNVLGVERNETRHSAFLCWLFNSNASHGLGEEPMKKLLRLYATKMNVDDSFRIMLMTGNYHLELTDIVTEKSTSDERADKAKRKDRMDVWATMTLKDSAGNDQSLALVIENKIYAGDQTNQMQRYCRYAKQHYDDNALVLYLTLNGRNPNDTSTGNDLKENEDYYAVSYADDIVQWLKLCLCECTFTPRIRETIGQYLDIIKQLTNNDMNEEYIHNINEILSSNPEATAAIFNCGLDKYLLYCFDHYAVPQFKDYAEKKGLIFGQENMQSLSYKGFFFRKPEWKHYAIWIYMDTPGQGYYCGVSNYNEMGEDKLAISNELSCLFNPNAGWPLGFSWLEEYRYWNAQTSIDIINGKFTAYLIKIVDMVLTDIEERYLEIP